MALVRCPTITRHAQIPETQRHAPKCCSCGFVARRCRNGGPQPIAPRRKRRNRLLQRPQYSRLVARWRWTLAAGLRQPRIPCGATTTGRTSALAEHTLSLESVADTTAASSQVTALSKLGRTRSAQHLRNGCARNPYAPRVSRRRDASHQKRSCVGRHALRPISVRTAMNQQRRPPPRRVPWQLRYGRAVRSGCPRLPLEPGPSPHRAPPP